MKPIAATCSVLLVSCAVGACSPAPTTVPCKRYDIAYLNDANDFKTDVSNPNWKWLDKPEENIGIALTIVRPTDGDVTLVQVIGGREVGRWDLRLGGDRGFSARCSIGFSNHVANCGAKLRDSPHPIGGHYYLLQNRNRVLEAGLSLYLCK